MEKAETRRVHERVSMAEDSLKQALSSVRLAKVKLELELDKNEKPATPDKVSLFTMDAKMKEMGLRARDRDVLLDMIREWGLQLQRSLWS